MTPTFTTSERQAEDPADNHVTDAAEGPLMFPCTPQQERWWFMDQLSPGNSSLNVAVRWEIRGKVDTSVIEQAFRIIIQRHEALRTRLIEKDGHPIQEVVPNADFRLSVLDLTNLAEAERTARTQAICEQAAREPFELCVAPLIRVTAIRTAAERTTLLIVIHHAVFDGWSIRVIGREIGELISALKAKRVPNLPELPLQYGDYALWLQEYIDSAAFNAEEDYWREKLKDLPYFEIEPDHPRPPVRTANGGMVSVMLDKESSERVDAFAKESGVSAFNLGCAVIATILHRMSGKDDIAFSAQIASRDDVDLENLIGVFINTLVFRFDTSGDPTFRELLQRAKETVRGALMHQRLPFHKLVEMLNPPRDLSRTPLVSINGILQRAFLENATYETFELVGVPSPTPGALYDLNFVMIGRPNGWRLSLEYSSDLFDVSTAHDILAGWKAALETASLNPDVPISAFPAPASNAERTGVDGQYSGICQALRSHPDVNGAAVVDTGGGILHAYVEPAPTTTTPLDVLPQLLMEHLKEACLSGPTVGDISVLFRLPRDGEGRIDLSALPAKPRPAPLTPTVAPAAAPQVSASPALEAAVAEIWKDVLKVSAVPPNANFFDLGGHSLLIVRMLMRIEEAFGKRFDVATLFAAPVFKDFVATLVRRGIKDPGAELETAVVDPFAVSDESWKTLVLCDKGNGVPIIGINNMATLYALVQQMGEDRPAICIRSYDPAYPYDFSRNTIPVIAEEYVQLIRRVRPHGPYILFGLCVHGVLSVEIARQLREAGEEVALISAVNCWAPGYGSDMSRWAQWRIRLHDVSVNFRNVLQGKRSLLAFLGTYSIVHRSGVLKLAKRLGLIKEIPTRTGNPEYDEFLLHLHRARAVYRPDKHDVDMLLFRDATTPQKQGLDATLGWNELAMGRCDVKWIPVADTGQPNDPGVAAMVKHLRRAFEEVDKRYAE